MLAFLSIQAGLVCFYICKFFEVYFPTRSPSVIEYTFKPNKTVNSSYEIFRVFENNKIIQFY